MATDLGTIFNDPNMPQRFLRPGLTDSKRWNALDWNAQSLYVRLITLVDDYGRYDADARLLKGHAFSLRDDVTLTAIVDMCKQLLERGLALFYKKDDLVFLQLTNWQERARSKSKYPDPTEPCCEQLSTIDNICLLPSPSSSPPPSPPPPQADGVEMPHNFPKTLAAALEIGDMANVPPDVTEQAWNKAMSRGGRDANRCPILSFSHYLATELKYHRSRQAEPANGSNGEIWKKKTQLEALRSTLLGHPARPDSLLSKDRITKEMRQEYKRIEADISKLERELGGLPSEPPKA